MDFRAGTAGAAADFPEVIFQTHDALVGNSHIFVPDFVSLIVGGVDGNVQLVAGQFQFFGQELPAPGNDFFLEVIAKGEISQHFKIGMVACRTSHVFNIAGAHTLLAGGHTGRRRLHLSGKERLERSHAGADQKQGRIILGNQGCTGQAHMSPFFKKFQKPFAEFIAAHVLHRFSLLLRL